ncbi:hypothetical protein EDD95_0915 [Streptomyces sp. CEV 2-1]|uniref:DUF5324 family protein n=1 Tax=Streptomyces sp. CEV 2-1 TaxID=2485153 RepID=UPI000F47258C|nr:DUF5324 family protein [Streptomyces sp. CEV 2-1]ROQ81355.1 hypothetical protein EDD95_0915 [Streptomyces sp. CEV 2-1]
MTRIDSVRAATDSARDSVQHAAEVAAPYADTAREQAVHYAQEARTLLAPKVSKAAKQARVQYGAHLAPRIELALTHVPPKVDDAAQRARQVARSAADYTVPRVEHAMAAAQPVAQEATARSAAALAALRGQVTPKEIRKLTRKHERRARAGRVSKALAVAGILAGSAYAVWRWWDKQANPDWLVEPPAPTEVDDRAPLTSVDGSGSTALDPDVQGKQADAETDGPDAVDGTDLDDRP